MAVRFTRATNQLAYTATPCIADFPFSVSAWVYVMDITNGHWLWAFVDEDTDNGSFHGIEAGGDVGGDPFRCVSYVLGLGAGAYAATTTGYSANTWHHICAVWPDANNRHVYIDGGSKGSSAVAKAIGPLNHESVGGLYRQDDPGDKADARMADFAVYNVALSDDDAEALAQHVCPLNVRPGGIARYTPFFGVDYNDWVMGDTWTPVNGPLTAEHGPPISYPFPEPRFGLGEAGGPGPVSGALQAWPRFW